MHKAGQIIAQEISAQGPITFARFMEIALYCPECGYYEAEPDTLGREGDFFTSVTVGPLFGQLLAFKFTEWLEGWAKTCPGPAKIAEVGAHDGTLARDVLEWVEENRKDPTDYEYWIVEPSAHRRKWQEATLGRMADRVRWATGLDGLAQAHPEGFCGVLYANEMLDAMPVQRLGWSAEEQQWFEWGVDLQEDRFVWSRLNGAVVSDHPLISRLPQALLAVLPDGFTTEVSLQAIEWWRAAAQVLRRGALAAFDYGLTTEEFFSPHRSAGTLRAYRQHKSSTDVLADPGKQDITAHVNFSLLQETGEMMSLKTSEFVPQSRFLTMIAEKLWSEEARRSVWTQAQTRQLRTLIDPGGLGRFKVLVQVR